MKNLYINLCLVFVLATPAFAQEDLSSKEITWHCDAFEDLEHSQTSDMICSFKIDSEQIIWLQGQRPTTFQIQKRKWKWEQEGKIIYDISLSGHEGKLKVIKKDGQTNIFLKLSVNEATNDFMFNVDHFTTN